MKTIILVFVAVVMTMGTFAQNTFFPTKVGTIQVYAQKNSKGKVDNYSRQIFKDIKETGNETTVSYVFEPLDKNQKPMDPPVQIPCKVIIKDDVVVMDMNEMFANMQKDQKMTEQMQMEITGVPMELPGNLTPGQALKDANITMTMNMGIMQMKTVINLTDGQCVAIEDLSVPAGTFKCHKITQTSTTTIMKRNIVTKTISWYAIGIGVVKTETYDDKNKLQNSSELIQLTLAN